MLHPQLLQAQTQRRRIASRDHGGGNARLLQQLEAVAIQCVKALDGFARSAEVQAAVGQHAIHIKKHHAHRLRLQQQCGVEVQSRAVEVAGHGGVFLGR